MNETCRYEIRVYTDLEWEWIQQNTHGVKLTLKEIQLYGDISMKYINIIYFE